MIFELDQELIGQIIFGMENQQEHFLFDTQERLLVKESTIDPTLLEVDGNRYLPLPIWNSASGFALMESFVTNLRNPLVHEALHQVLLSGKGVFRNFKNTLKDNPDVERLWFRHKEREMQKCVFEWYNELRDMWGMEPLQEETEPGTEDLILADFTFATCNPVHEADIISMDNDSFPHMFPNASIQDLAWYQFLYRAHVPLPCAETKGAFTLVAETPGAELAGFCWSFLETDDHRRINCSIAQLFVVPEFRGLGLGQVLLRQFIQEAINKGVHYFQFQIPQSSAFMNHILEHAGFHPHSTTWDLHHEK